MNDSHMVASGVPDKNGDRHASIIASMALDVMVSFGLNVKVSTDYKKTINERRPFKKSSTIISFIHEKKYSIGWFYMYSAFKHNRRLFMDKIVLVFIDEIA